MGRVRTTLVVALAVATVTVVALDATGVLDGPIRPLFVDDSVAVAPLVDLAPAGASNAPVLANLNLTAPVSTPSGVARALKPFVANPAFGSGLSVAVTDAASNAPLYALRADASVMPASTLKLLTAVSALQVLGPDRTLVTKVVGVPGSGTITLVGGGDPSLRTGTARGSSAPSLANLAGRTASTLKQRGITGIKVTYDASLFQAPTVSPQWPAAYVSTGVVSPVTALNVDSGKVVASPPDKTGVRFVDPALTTAQRFATQLRAKGITVSGPVAPAQASTSAADIASVSSAPMVDLVQHMLTNSDNDYAESLAHLTGAAAGTGGTFVGGAAATLSTLQRLGIDTAGLALYDGSGLARSNRLTASALNQVALAAASAQNPALRGAITGLAVAGFNGTLADRFDQGPQRLAAGTTRAKTGTLTGVTALAGTLVDLDGRLLSFAIVAESPTDPAGARAAIDRMTTRLAACGCR